MTRVPIADVRLRAYLALLIPSFVGHTIQLTGEDVPWSVGSWERSFITPGWHLALPLWAPLVIAIALATAVVALAVKPGRATFLAVAATYAAHYLTYPWRIRNHMTTMLAGLVVVALVMIVARASGALVPGRSHARRVDAMAVRGLGLVIAVQYFFAGLHKLNPGFVDASPTGVSAAVDGTTRFWIHGDLGSSPPAVVLWIAVVGTIAIEMGAPLVALAAPRLAMIAVGVLMLFHLPQVAVMDVADYPMIASAFYPALLTHRDALRVARHFGPSRWTIAGASIGAAAQLWFMPWWGGLTVLGIFVLGLWGWTLGAMARATWTRRASAQSTRGGAPSIAES
jgi:hypothetical protein